MSIVLPSTPVKASRLSPKITVLYGLPKVGKTEILSQLEECLIADTEGGTEMYECLKVPVRSSAEFRGLISAIIAEGKARYAQGKTGLEQFPYPYIAIDTLDKLEEYAEEAATIKYKESVIGKTFKGKSVLELANGGGYYYLRNELAEMVDAMAAVTPRLILITHVKEKLLNKAGEDVKVNDISLTGKMSSIICAKADAIGYLYREVGKPQLMVSFETFDNTVMGARCKHLAGQKFPFDWSRIYID